MHLLNKPAKLLQAEVPETSPLSKKSAFSKLGSFRVGFKSENLLASFSYAWEGILYAARTQRNFRIHLALGAFALTLSSVLQISLVEWTIIWGCIGIVLFAELMNTAIELLVDMLTEGRFDLRAKAIKDTAAGAVFVTAIAALACGVCVFVPHVAKLVAS
jgi:diacylglycerol kinase (ATP)